LDFVIDNRGKEKEYTPLEYIIIKDPRNNKENKFINLYY